MSSDKEAVGRLIAEQRKRTVEDALKNERLSPQQKVDLLAQNQDQRLSIIKAIQKHTLEHLFKKNSAFYTNKYHYDWWVFPMHVPKEWGWQQRNYDASITPSEAVSLLADKSFVETYLTCISLYLDALEKNGWNNYPVRYARMLHSVGLFLQVAKGNAIQSGDVTLHQEAERSINFAEQNLVEDNSHYGLFLNGYSWVKDELKKQDFSEKNREKTSMNPCG